MYLSETYTMTHDQFIKHISNPDVQEQLAEELRNKDTSMVENHNHTISDYDRDYERGLRECVCGESTIKVRGKMNLSIARGANLL